jgi:hypothetical protein
LENLSERPEVDEEMADLERDYGHEPLKNEIKRLVTQPYKKKKL